ncbi:MAG: hypothetical protein ACRDQ7_22030 [Haloechinothrix sp.]
MTDRFPRFWFRFAFPYQSDLEAGQSPTDLYDTEIAPALADHVAPTFEECGAHARHTLVLYAKAGFTQALRTHAEGYAHLHLVDGTEALSNLA